MEGAEGCLPLFLWSILTRVVLGARCCRSSSFFAKSGECLVGERGSLSLRQPKTDRAKAPLARRRSLAGAESKRARGTIQPGGVLSLPRPPLPPVCPPSVSRQNPSTMMLCARTKLQKEGTPLPPAFCANGRQKRERESRALAPPPGRGRLARIVFFFCVERVHSVSGFFWGKIVVEFCLGASRGVEFLGVSNLWLSAGGGARVPHGPPLGHQKITGTRAASCQRLPRPPPPRLRSRSACTIITRMFFCAACSR